MNYPQANQAYTEASVLSAPPGQLVVMLYDGALRFMQQAVVAMEAGQQEMSRNRIHRAEKIIDELNQCLNMEEGGEIAVQLRSLYLFCKRELMQALINQDAEKIKKLIELLRDLRGAWAQVSSEQQPVTSG